MIPLTQGGKLTKDAAATSGISYYDEMKSTFQNKIIDRKKIIMINIAKVNFSLFKTTLLLAVILNQSH